MCHLYRPWVCKISEQERRTTTLGTLKELVAQDMEPEDVPHGKAQAGSKDCQLSSRFKIESIQSLNFNRCCEKESSSRTNIMFSPC